MGNGSQGMVFNQYASYSLISSNTKLALYANRLGINTNNPTEALEVYGNIKGTNDLIVEEK